MKKFLLIFCLGLIFNSSIYSQECILFDDDPNTPVICFSDDMLSNPAEIFLTAAEFSNFDPNSFIVQFPDALEACNTAMSLRIIRNSNIRDQRSSSRSNEGEILDIIIFEVAVPMVDPVTGDPVLDPVTGDPIFIQSENCNETLTLTIRAAAEPIPTLSQWGLMIFGLIVINIGCLYIIEYKNILA